MSRRGTARATFPPMPADLATPFTSDIPASATGTPPHISGKRRNVAAAAIILLIFVLGFWPSFEKAAAPMDEGSLLVYPELVLHGNVPYRDFETFYGPANPYVLAGTYGLFGPGIFVERTVGLVYRLLILLAVFGLLKRCGTSVAAVCSGIAGVVLLTTQLAAYAWLGGVACGLCALWALADPEPRWRTWAGGFLSGAALLYQPDLAPAVLLATAPLLWAMSGSARLRFCLGASIALLPFAILAIIAGPSALLSNLFLEPVIYSSPGRRLPILTAPALNVRLLSAHALAAIANVIAAVIAVRQKPTTSKARVLLAASLFALALTPQALQRLDGLHLAFVAFLSIGLLPLSLLLLCKRSHADRSEFGVGLLVSTVLVAALVGGAAPKIWTNAYGAFVAAVDPSMGSSIFLEQNGRSFPFPSRSAADVIGKLLEKLDRLSKPGERLFVGPADLRRTNNCDTFIYHLFPALQPATYFLEMNPGSANREGSRLTTDIASADWLVLDMAWDNWPENNSLSVYGPDAPNEVVRSEFSLVGQYGPFVLLKHNR